MSSVDSWHVVYGRFEHKLQENPDDVKNLVSALYFLIDLALEGPVRGEIDWVKEAKEIGSAIEKLFNSTCRHFENNPEYLFSFGYFLVLTDWYFGSDILEIAGNMSKRAAELEPTNILYKWAANRPSESLRKQVLANSEIITWLKSKGEYGEYIESVLHADMSNI